MLKKRKIYSQTNQPQKVNSHFSHPSHPSFFVCVLFDFPLLTLKNSIFLPSYLSNLYQYNVNTWIILIFDFTILFNRFNCFLYECLEFFSLQYLINFHRFFDAERKKKTTKRNKKKKKQNFFLSSFLNWFQIPETSHSSLLCPYHPHYYLACIFFYSNRLTFFFNLFFWLLFRFFKSKKC